MKRIPSVLILLLCFITSFTQNYPINKTIEYISESNQPIHIFGNKNTSRYLSLNKPIDKNIQSIIKCDSSIFCFVDGTGIIFKYSKPQGLFSRIDSTIFSGYNNGAFCFCYKSNIYNLGGSGIWKSNGQLRKYNFLAHEWDIVPLNEEIPIVSGQRQGMVYYDQLNGIIYSGYSLHYNDGKKTQAEEYTYKVMSLDLQSTEWSNLGGLNQNLIQDITKESNLAITPFGLLTINNNSINLWDFKNNKHFQLNEDKSIFQSIKRAMDTTVVFYKNNHLFLSSSKNSLDSIKLTIRQAP